MTIITEGMTPVQFLAALNDNFTTALGSGNFTTITNAMHGDDIQTALNNNFPKSDTLVGIRGSRFASIINGNFSSYPTVTWEDDYAKIDIIDNSGGTAQHEIWESKNDGAYSLSYTLPVGVLTYNYYTWQNANLKFKTREKNGTSYSAFSLISNIDTPLILKCNQSTLIQIVFAEIQMLSPGVIHFDWDDGNEENYSNINYDVGLTHDWSVQKNPYYIKISGDINNIRRLLLYDQVAILAGTDITKWNLPDISAPYNFFCHLWNNGFIGDITNWELPTNIGGIHLVSNTLLTGDLTNWKFDYKPYWWDLHLGACNFTGNLTNWTFGANMAHVILGGNLFTGDLSGWDFPLTPAYGGILYEFSNAGFTGDLLGWVLPDKPFIIESQDGGFTGDLSGWILPDGLDGVNNSILFWNTHFTKLPRGNFRRLSVYNFWKNSCDSDELDNLLAYIDSYFVGGVVPLQNCVYTLNGTGMGIPSAAGLISRTSIIGKYTAEGKTCSILVNS